MIRALVLGGAGFIGMALTKRLKEEGAYVRAMDIRNPPFDDSTADHFVDIDLRDAGQLEYRIGDGDYHEVYQLACDMGGAGYIFTGEHDAEVITNNVLINANVAKHFSSYGCGRLLYTSSSCVYSDDLGENAEWGKIEEKDVSASYVSDDKDSCGACPSNSYGWEKLFSEKLYDAYRRNHGLNVGITRFSTIYGPGSCFDDGREKAVAAIIRKAIDAPDGGEVEVWGDGEQIRPYVYIDDLVDALIKMMRTPGFAGPVNISGTEMTSCNDVARHALARSGKNLKIKNVPGPIGKQVLNMTTDLAERELGWKATTPFEVGFERTFDWIASRKSFSMMNSTCPAYAGPTVMVPDNPRSDGLTFPDHPIFPGRFSDPLVNIVTQQNQVGFGFVANLKEMIFGR